MKKVIFTGLIFITVSASGQSGSVGNSKFYVPTPTPAFQKLYASQDALTGNISSYSMVTVNGKLVRGNINTKEFFFKDEWMNGKIKLVTGEVYENVKVKINLLNHTLHYLQRDTDFVVQSPVLEVFITDSSNKETIHFVHANNLKREFFQIGDGWYQSLARGKVTLYKKIEKKVESSRAHGSATTAHSIVTTEKFLLLHSQQFDVIKKWKDLEKIFAEDQTMLQIMAKEKKKHDKFRDQLLAVVQSYNSANK